MRNTLVLAGLFALSAPSAFAETVTVTGTLSTIQDPYLARKRAVFIPTIRIAGEARPLLLDRAFRDNELAMLHRATVTLQGVMTPNGFRPTSNTLTVFGHLGAFTANPAALRQHRRQEIDYFHLGWAGGAIKVKASPLSLLGENITEPVALTGTLVLRIEKPYRAGLAARFYPGYLEIPPPAMEFLPDSGGSNVARWARTVMRVLRGPEGWGGGQSR